MSAVVFSHMQFHDVLNYDRKCYERKNPP